MTAFLVRFRKKDGRDSVSRVEARSALLAVWKVRRRHPDAAVLTVSPAPAGRWWRSPRWDLNSAIR